MIIRLAYTSLLTPAMNAEQLGKLIEDAAAANKTHEIGGAIAFDERRVCQILEGEEKAVVQLFANIKADRRHRNVMELDRSTVADRRFTSWGMTQRPMIDMVMFAYSALSA